MKLFFSLIVPITIGELTPFLVFGKDWGLIWFLVNVPLSICLEERVGISEDTPYWLLFVTLVNASAFAIIISGLFSVFCAITKRSFNAERNRKLK